MGLDQTVAGAFVAGVLSFLSPCILPLVAPYLCWLTGADLDRLAAGDAPGATPSRAFSRAAGFVAGFSTVFVALGASASMVGMALARWFDALTVVAGLAIIAMGLNFLGILRIGLFMREARASTSDRPTSLLGAYVVGLAFAFGWTPCVGPVLAAILMVAGAAESTGRGVALLSAYAAGIGIPFLAAAAFVGPFLRAAARFRRHLGTVEKIMGVALVVTGLVFVTGSMATVSNWLLETFPVLGRIG